MLTRSYIALGSNLENPTVQIKKALTAFTKIPQTHLIATSSLYLNPPLGTIQQPDFVNAVVALDTELTAETLLIELQKIEEAHGRTRPLKQWGEPRTLDLDLILFGNEIINSPTLKVPHPGLTTRNFVLYPLAEIAPNLQLPTNIALSTLLANCSAMGLEKIIE